MTEQRALTQLGLTQVEARAYLTLVGRKPLTAYTLARETGIPRTSIYNAMETLRRKSLVTSIRRNNVVHFEAASPQILLDIVREQGELVQSVLPMLLARSRESKYDASAKFFTGHQGVKAALDELYDYLERKRVKNLYTVSHPEFLAAYPRILPSIIKRRERLGIHTSLIAPHTAARNTPFPYQSNELRETRFLPKEFPFHCTMIVGGLQVIFLSFAKDTLYALKLDSEPVADMCKQLFLFVWQTLAAPNGAATAR